MRLIDFFDKGVELDPARAFLVEGDRVRTYAQAQLFSHRFANALHRAGVKPGTKAAVFSPNAARPFECVIGILRAGCVWAPVNARNSAEDNVYILNNTDTEVLVYAAVYGELVRELMKGCPRIALTVCVEEADDLSPSLDDFIAGVGDVAPDIPQTPDTVVVLNSSGGTTGAPKGVMMPNRAWAAMIGGSLKLNWIEGAVHLVAAPMTHAAGGSALIMAPMGATNVLLAGFEPLSVMQAIERHRVTHLFLPPTAIYRLLAHPDVRNHDYSSLRFFTYASAPMAPEKVKEAMEVFGPVMTSGFGQSESGVNVTHLSPRDHVRILAGGDERRLTSVGRATLFNRVEIMDDEGALLPPEAVGEIVLRGDQLMSGYYNNPKETERADAFGWRHTGDMGFKDAEGWVFLVDRKRDMIISGGFNVFPAVVEKVLVTHPDVQDCAVVGTPDDEWGERVTAVVEAKAGRAIDPAEVMAFGRERLGGVNAPKQVLVWPELPRSPVGKVLRRKVREHFWQGRQRVI